LEKEVSTANKACSETENALSKLTHEHSLLQGAYLELQQDSGLSSDCISLNLVLYSCFISAFICRVLCNIHSAMYNHTAQYDQTRDCHTHKIVLNTGSQFFFCFFMELTGRCVLFASLVRFTLIILECSNF
jgi:hypothetical protein